VVGGMGDGLGFVDLTETTIQNAQRNLMIIITGTRYQRHDRYKTAASSYLTRNILLSLG
jgi:hypothetical protein